MARIYHTRERTVISGIAIPHSVPYIFAGLRIGLAKGMVGVIIGEMDISLKGLGGLITNYGDAFNTASLLAAIISSSMVGVVGVVIIEGVRRWIAPWAPRSDAATRV